MQELLHKPNISKVHSYTEYYQDILRIRPHTLRSIARHVLLHQLSFFNSFRNSVLKKPRIQFLYVHHLFRDEEQQFDQLIKNLLVHHDIISYSQAVERILISQIDKPYIVISSDDGFKNNLRLAEILDSYGLQACFFINPSIVGVDDYNKITDYCQNKLHLPPVEFMTWDDVESLLKNGHEIGSHTMVHDNVAMLSPERIREDMSKTFEILNSRLGSVKHFAFPYGRFSHFNETARKACFDAGFLSCASAERGCHVNGFSGSREELCIRRDHVILDWDYSHIEYFLIEASRKADPEKQFFPYKIDDAHPVADKLA